VHRQTLARVVDETETTDDDATIDEATAAESAGPELNVSSLDKPADDAGSTTK
jgi:hypothetical protein